MPGARLTWIAGARLISKVQSGRNIAFAEVVVPSARSRPESNLEASSAPLATGKPSSQGSKSKCAV
ncbi:hypothetical protein D3C81_1917230 [compost metagenome]